MGSQETCLRPSANMKNTVPWAVGKVVARRNLPPVENASLSIFNSELAQKWDSLSELELTLGEYVDLSSDMGDCLEAYMLRCVRASHREFEKRKTRRERECKAKGRKRLNIQRTLLELFNCTIKVRERVESKKTPKRGIHYRCIDFCPQINDYHEIQFHVPFSPNPERTYVAESFLHLLISLLYQYSSGRHGHLGRQESVFPHDHIRI